MLIGISVLLGMRSAYADVRQVLGQARIAQPYCDIEKFHAHPAFELQAVQHVHLAIVKAGLCCALDGDKYKASSQICSAPTQFRLT